MSVLFLWRDMGCCSPLAVFQLELLVTHLRHFTPDCVHVPGVDILKVQHRFCGVSAAKQMTQVTITRSCFQDAGYYTAQDTFVCSRSKVAANGPSGHPRSSSNNVALQDCQSCCINRPYMKDRLLREKICHARSQLITAGQRQAQSMPGISAIISSVWSSHSEMLAA